jgi:hypothetical protein
MTTHSTLRRSLLASTSVLAGIALLGTGTAQAADSTKPATKTASVSAAGTTTTLWSYGSNALIPTWFWGGTTLCARNIGSSYGAVRVQSATGAPPEYISSLAPYQEKCINRWWWGVPVYVTNVSSTPVQVRSY